MSKQKASTCGQILKQDAQGLGIYTMSCSIPPFSERLQISRPKIKGDSRENEFSVFLSSLKLRMEQTILAEGKGFEPSTHCWASDFESDRWPIRIPSEANFFKVYHTLKSPYIG